LGFQIYPDGIDMLVEDERIIELKAVEEIKAIHAAQLLTCMKRAGTGTGLPLNSNVTKLKNGIRRYIL
jgi:GxxExxY protein